MKKILFALLVVSFLSVAICGLSLAAQDNAAQRGTDKSDMTMTAVQNTSRMSEILDKTVKEKEGGDVGQIEDVIIDTNGQASYAVLAGPYNKLYPIPMQALNQREEDGAFYLNMTKEQLQNAPNFSKDQWDELTGLQWEQNVRGYYGAQSQPKY